MRVLVLILAIALAGCATETGASPGTQATAPTAEPTAASSEAASQAPASEAPSAPPSAAAGKPLTFKGTGSKKTAPFPLAAGDYRIDWTAKASSSVGCFHGGFLSPTSSDVFYSADTGSGTFNDAKTHGDTTFAYGVPEGTFFLDMTSGCTWTVTLTRQ